MCRPGETSRTVPPVTGPHVIPFLPSFIPAEVCLDVGIDPAAPDAPRVCMDQVQADVVRDGVSARTLTDGQRDELHQVVSQARADGVDLKVVVISRDPGLDTPLRDMATEVGQANPGATVLVLSPSRAGTYSPTFDRVTLEAGEDLAKTGNPAQSTQNFVSQLQTPDFPWTALTIVLTVGVLLAAVLTRYLQQYAKSKDSANPQVGDVSSGSD